MLNCPNTKNQNVNIEECTILDTFKDFIQYKESQGLSEYTKKTYQNHINFFIKTIGNKNINEVSTYDYKQFLEVLKNRNISQATIKSYSNTLRSFFNYAFDNNYMYYKVNVEYIKAQTQIKQTYSNEELEKLLKKPNVRKCTFTTYKVWVLENLVISTGLRITSVLNIKIKDLDLSNHSIIVNTTKNKKAFITYLNLDMLQILKEYLSYRGGEQEDFLFCTNEGKQISRRTMQQEIRDYNLSRGVEKTSIHLLRHTFARNSILQGQDVFTLMHMLQHNDITTTYNYLKTLGLDIKDRVDVYNPQRMFNSNNKKITMH